MLDVHPPHAATHTWRDFFIHIATIVVGLLIAIGLEQSVEWLHHHHQRHQLIEDLHQEALINKGICEHDVRYFDKELGWLLDVKAYVDAFRVSHGKVAGDLPPDYADAELLYAGTVGDADPETAVWMTARESGLLDLLPREHAARLSVVYSAAALEMEQDKVMLKELNEWTGLLTASRQQPYKMNLAGKSEAELVTLSQAVGEEISAMNAERRYLLLFYGENNAVLDGAENQQQFRAEIARAYQRFPNPYEVPVPPLPHPARDR